jgi:D-tyrosyl-tRNA(Tyr) deacylase
MRVVVQRVLSAKVEVDRNVVGSIDSGLLVFLGISAEDSEKDADYLLKKITALRIFDDENGVMNKSLVDVKGEFLVVSQFTLQANTKKGNRPSYIQAARPEKALPIYHYFLSQAEGIIAKEIASGEFGADMKVSLENDGPVTFVLDSR